MDASRSRNDKPCVVPWRARPHLKKGLAQNERISNTHDGETLGTKLPPVTLRNEPKDAAAYHRDPDQPDLAKQTEELVDELRGGRRTGGRTD